MDDTGQFLTGEKRHVLHFQAGHLPPVDAFWSLSLYSAKDFFFVENPIHRYSLGNRTSGLIYNSDGSLDVYIQHDAPLGKEANWLPAPPDTFLLMLRLYQPKEDAVSGAYQYPPVKLMS